MVTNVMNKETFSFGRTKALEPDGFNGSFIQKYWELIGMDVFEGVRNFMSLVSLICTSF